MRKRSLIYMLLLVSTLLSLTLFSLVSAQESINADSYNASEAADVKTTPAETGEVSLLTLGGEALTAAPARSPFSPAGAITMREVEPNGTAATANAISGSGAIVRGDTFPGGDIDFFSFTAQAGDRVYAATMTAFSAGGTDSTLDIIATDGATILETDVSDGSLAASSSSIAGTTLPASGTYYIRVRSTTATASATMRPYDLYFQLRSGSPTAETEPNNAADGGQAMPASSWVSGSVDPAADNDVFLFGLNAGDTVFLSLDLDPERDGGTGWNGRVGLGAFGNPASTLLVNDASITSPNSEAFFFTVKEAGTYYAYVDHPTALGDPAYTYHLSASVFPIVPETASCTTYTSANVPVTIPAGPGLVTSTLTVPGNPFIADLDVTIVLTHTNMPDLDVVLVSPGGNEVIMFNDRGVNTQQGMNLTLDDEAAIPITSFTIMSGMVYQPQSSSRLAWFDGQNAGGDWTLKVYDDLAVNGGALQNWALTICEPPPPPSCPTGFDLVTVFSSDFEADNGGFTTSGTAVDWAWGAPTAVPLNTCNSGANCWVTNLAGDYSPSSNQNLLSPSINLSGLFGPIQLTWAQKHQIESANWDNAFVDVQQVGGGSPQRIWEWRDAMLRTTVGSPSVTTQPSDGWRIRRADISSFAGQQVELRFNLFSDSSVNFAGIAVDDVTITACAPPQGTPIIDLNKTVGTDSSVCASGSAISVGPGDEVTYCYEVTNTGTLTLTLHDLEDDKLGDLLSAFPYSLVPGASAFITETSVITQTTTNVATWTAYNAGPTGVISDTASATVTVVPPSVSLDKTVGTDPAVCATTDVINVIAGTTVVYCYEVTNSGLTTLNLHDLVDSELGSLLNGFAYALTPGASVFLTETAVINVTTVNTATWTAYNAGPTFVSTDSDTATVNVIVPSNGLPLEDFNAGTAGFPPAGWSVINNGGTCVWESTETTGYANLTGGSGFAAEANSDDCGSGSTMNTELRTPFFNLTGAISPVLTYRYDYRDLGVTDQGAVDISTDGGATWTNLATYLISDRGPKQNIVDLTAYIGQPLLQVRFTYFAPGWDWWFQIDDVAVLLESSPEIVVTPADLSSNQLPDTTTTQSLNIANTGAGTLNWDIVEAPATCTTPGDIPWLSVNPITGTLAAGSNTNVSVTFDSTGLVPANYDGVICVESDDPGMPVVAVPVELVVEPTPPDIAVAPEALTAVLDPNTNITNTLTISNYGMLDLTWNVNEASMPQAIEDIGDAWETMAPLPEGRVFNAVVADENGYLYVIGGTSDAGALIPTNTNFRYNTATNTWDTMAVVPTTLDSIDGALIGNKIYIPGDELTATTYVYDIATNAWSTIATNGGYTARSQYQAVAMGTDLYVLGGITAGASTTQVWVLDTVTGTWTAGVPMQRSRTSFSAGMVNGQIYVAGGVAFPGFAPDMTAETFDGVTWSFVAGVPTGGGAYTRWSYNADGQTSYGLWVAAGRRDAGWTVLNHAGYYDPSTDSWADSPTIPMLAQARVYMEGDVASDGYFYVIGGRDSAGAIIYATNERLMVDAEPSPCSSPSDLPWVSVNPASGTTSGGAASEVDVLFDSTGLSAGVYSGLLCINSNDPVEPLVEVPVELEVTAVLTPDISLTKTVGTEPGVCATMDTITVMAGTDVYYCYEVENTGNVTLNLHDLEDDELGEIFAGLNYALTPGSSVNTVAAGLTISATINVTTTNTATWMAYNDGPTDVVTATASATVNVTPLPVAAIEIVKTVGTEDGVCAATSEITVQSGTTVYYCYSVTNIGSIPLNVHDLEDDVLGEIFAGLNYALTPGSSVNTVAAGLTISATITGTTTNIATWTAYNAGPTDVATATASATVNVAVFELYLPIIMKP
jgi:subtilisin-like proprotein convertase family protein